jgi:hypothetical protein
MPFFRFCTQIAKASIPLAVACSPILAPAMGLIVEGETACSAPLPSPAPQTPLPAPALERLADSQATAGQNHIAWVWLGSPTLRYPHRAFGNPQHAGSVHAQVKDAANQWTTIKLTLPLNRVFEDRLPRLVDIDGDGQDEILLVESDALQGSALVVYGVDRGAKGQDQPKLVQRAMGPRTGSTFRWLNPVGVADFDGDGRLDIASVTTPHIGGTLTLHHYRPAQLVPFAKTVDVSNHRMGSIEQRMSVIMQSPGLRPTIVVPDMTRRALHALRWEAPGQWKELANLIPMPGLVEQLTLRADGSACAVLSDGSKFRISLTP